MNELTMVLDELDSLSTGEAGSSSQRMRNWELPTDCVHRLISALRSQGGDMGRVASVIETMANHSAVDHAPPRYACPSGSVRTPGDRKDMRTLTAGNGVMSGTGM